MRRRPVELGWVVVLAFTGLIAFAVGATPSSAIKRRTSCDDDLEATKTQLRLRTAELRVAHGQLDSAWKKLKACGVSTEE